MKLRINNFKEDQNLYKTLNNKKTRVKHTINELLTKTIDRIINIKIMRRKYKN